MQVRIAMALIGCGVIAAAPAGPRLADPSTAIAVDSVERARALHALNRLAFGPRQGDVDRVAAMGVDRWIERQLQPESLSDDSLENHLVAYEVLRLTTDELATIFRREQMARRERQRAMAGDSMGAAPRPPNDAARRRMMERDPTRLRTLIGQFQQVAVTRAVLSERQLNEVMVDFWTNHFNVFLGKTALRYLTPEYIEEVIRPNALGRFEDLLAATAQSPAMMFYLDNFQSVAAGSEPPELADVERRMQRMRSRPGGRPGARSRREQQQRDQLRQAEERMRRMRERLPTGINENYARELLELHTLGVDGGYTQQDVVEVARILTGWSVERPGRDGTGFVFNAWAHDDGAKVVIGREFPAGRGMDEGLDLLNMLARHPSTMRHISAKLCTRFVSDDPPAGCVEAGVRAWQDGDGDIRAVLRAVIASPEFWAEEYRGAKTKSPLEYVTSAVRALDGRPDATPGLARIVARLGQPMYMRQPPDGYPETQGEWVNAGALLNRLNIALGLGAGRAPGITIDLDRVAPLSTDLDVMVSAVNRVVLNGTAGTNTLRVMRAQAERAENVRRARATAVAYALGSPEFQRQ